MLPLSPVPGYDVSWIVVSGVPLLRHNSLSKVPRPIAKKIAAPVGVVEALSRLNPPLESGFVVVSILVPASVPSVAHS